MKRQKGKKTIREVLKDINYALYIRLENLWQIVKKEIHPRQQSSDGHKTGTEHCEKVEDNLNKLIPDESKMEKYKPIDLFILSASACLHDAGKTEESETDHGYIAKVEIETNYQKYGLSKYEALIIGKIVGAHNDDRRFDELPVTEPLEGETIEVCLLAALLRLADVLHTYYTRVPSISLGINKESAGSKKTRFRECVSGWDFDEEGEIYLQTYPEKEEDLEILLKGVELMNEELSHVTPYLKEQEYPTRINLKEDWLRRALKEEKKVKGFVGMDSLSGTDVFKGRDKETYEIFGKIGLSPIVLLVGDSGVGKTSLINAGLFNILKRFTNWKYALTRPFVTPLKSITESLRTQLLPEAKFGYSDLLVTIQILSRNYQDKNVLVVLDQFEDVIRAPKNELYTLGAILNSINTHRFVNIHVLIAYRSDAEAQIANFLQNHLGRIPETKIPLVPLDKDETKEALRSGFEAEEVGRKDESLIDKIVTDLEKESEFLGKEVIYPPFIQMVGSTLCNKAKEKDSIVTNELYVKELGGAKRIIGNFLFNQLQEFGTMRSYAEEILKKLVYEGKKTSPKSRTELKSDIRLKDEEFLSLLDMLVKKRMIRPFGDFFEIIHDYLAERVEKELVLPKEKPLRHALSILESKSSSYKTFWNLLTPMEMVVLYSSREEIENTVKQDPKKMQLLLHSCLAEQGPAWWWFRNMEKSDYLPHIVEGLKSEAHQVGYNWVREGAEMAFVNLCSHDDLPLIKEMLKDSNWWIMRRTAVEALGKLGTYDDLPLLRQTLKDTNDFVKKAAVEVLGNFGTHDDLPLIKEVLKVSNWLSMRRTAVEALGKLGTHNDLPLFKEMLKDSYSDERDAAVEAFGKLATRDDLPLIKEMLKDNNLLVREAAVKALGNLGTHDDLPLFKEMLKDPDWSVRVYAVEALGKLATHDDLPLIKEMLKDNNLLVREAAVKALGKLGTHDDLPLFKEMLKDPDWSVRVCAVEVLGTLGNRDDLPLFKEMLKDPDWSVRVYAVEVLGKLGNQDDLPLFKEMLKDNNEFVRVAAVVALGRIGSDEELMLIISLLVSQKIDGTKRGISTAISMDRKLYCPFKWG